VFLCGMQETQARSEVLTIGRSEFLRDVRHPRWRGKWRENCLQLAEFFLKAQFYQKQMPTNARITA